MYQGSYVAVASPFRAGELDQDSLRRNVDFLIRNGSAGIVACATTGEGPTLSDHEYISIIKVCIEVAKGRVPVIASAGTNCTSKTVRYMHRAQVCGADGLLIVTPYYNKPSQEGLYQHYKVLGKETDLPIIIYNVPGRTGINILPKTVARLVADAKQIKAIKEASGNLDQVSELAKLTGKNFDILSGDDSLTLPMLAIGAKGVVSVVANILPKAVADMCKAFFQSNLAKARQLHLKLFPLTKMLFIETNPIPLKKAMELMGMAAGKPRLPLTEMSQGNTLLLKSALKNYGIKL